MFRHFLQGLLPGIRSGYISHPGGQTDKAEIQLGVIHLVVALIRQISVEILHELHNLVQIHVALENVHVQNPAQLFHGVPLALGRRQKSPLHPVLNGVGFQPGETGHLGQGQPSRQKQGMKHLIHLLRLFPLGGKGGSRYDPLQTDPSFRGLSQILLPGKKEFV